MDRGVHKLEFGGECPRPPSAGGRSAEQQDEPSFALFENTRFDPDLTPFHHLAMQMAAQFGYSAELSVVRNLLQLLRLRVAQLNPCSYCLILHAEVAARIGVPSWLAAHLPSWRDRPGRHSSESP